MPTAAQPAEERCALLPVGAESDGPNASIDFAGLPARVNAGLAPGEKLSAAPSPIPVCTDRSETVRRVGATVKAALGLGRVLPPRDSWTRAPTKVPTSFC